MLALTLLCTLALAILGWRTWIYWQQASARRSRPFSGLPGSSRRAVSRRCQPPLPPGGCRCPEIWGAPGGCRLWGGWGGWLP